jgi:hypothetical protein
MGYNDCGSADMQIAKEVRMPSLRENMHYELEQARKNVARLEELTRLLEANPETQRILELLGRKY